MLEHLGGVILTFLATFGVIAFFSNLISNHGNELQTRLFSEWGKAPTTALLRFVDSYLDPYTKERYHRWLEAMVPELRMPTHEQEQAEPLKADACFASAGAFLREHSRDRSKYPMIYSDNVAYGYARNLLLMKPFGIAAAALGLLANVVFLYVDISAYLSVDGQRSLTMQFDCGIGATLLSLAMLWVFTGVVNKEYVKGRAVRYAKSLLAACEEST